MLGFQSLVKKCLTWTARSKIGNGLTAPFVQCPLLINELRVLQISIRTYYPSRAATRNQVPPPKKYPPLVPITHYQPNVAATPTRPIWQTRRCGMLAYKLGCMSLWDEWGERHPITVCLADSCVVLQQRTLHTHGYEALQLGMGYIPPRKVSIPNQGHFLKSRTSPKSVVKEFKCTSDAFLPVGHVMSVQHFTPGQWVFVSSWSKAKGFQGPMKRWGFGGGPASHGAESKMHSGHGAVSQGSSVNLVWKFKKMAGHHGPDPRCVNCRVFRLDPQRNLIFLRGAVPGEKGSVIKISDARGKTHAKNSRIFIHYPTYMPTENEPIPEILQQPCLERDPFLFPDVPIYDKEK